jgi:peptidoglycan/xylan/chitin deacetylase (PgdA/CDA1 family)
MLPWLRGSAVLHVLCGAAALASAQVLSGCAAAREEAGAADAQRASLSAFGDNVAWSRKPPGLEPVDVPQFVAVTFDDNFVSGLGDVSGGMTWATTFFKSLQNPAGSGFLPTWDGAAVRTTFYVNCVYLQDDDTKKSWSTARQDGHEIANHTVNHPNGGAFTLQNWTDEIAPCTEALTNPEHGVGVTIDEVRGFRAPYLAYSSELFAALKAQGLWYDTSIQSCWNASDDGKSCAWPYTLDQGSPDAVDLAAKFATKAVPPATGLWELTPSALFIPPDELAAQYGFDPGLRQRVPTDMPAPSFYEPTTGRIAPLDVTLFVDAGLAPTEVLATLKYTLDLRLSGNRAPFVFIGHTHVYASSYGAAPKAPDSGARQHAIEDFIHYALTKPSVRMRPVADILTWMRHPEPLNGVVTALPSMGGAGAGGASAGNTATNGGAGAGAGGASGGAAQAGSASPSVSGTGPEVTEVSPDAACTCYSVGSGRSRSGSGALLVVGALALLGLARREKMPMLGPIVRFVFSLSQASSESLPLASSSDPRGLREPDQRI